MRSRISMRLDDEVRHALEAEARSRNLGLSTLLREIATEAARQIKRRRIREQSEAVGRYVASSPEAAEFLEFWGTPRMEGLGKPPKLRSKRGA
jgi:hypothetical protein